ncbi:MAG TPA: imidazole glycerol phosphate synthase subunit HisH [Spirochaetota bacterium]|nr:imidazole glycerol phosphate synthase subunit HisH [Spirochaetota bacterium]HPI89488.1 imidazole glycerol phosphate synthase subunit HisH [Spirochaetota bacterium]HPR49561.1 imidazole glycerol phosphate synthase subunit HisH [Spirochaetota bacterium]
MITVIDYGMGNIRSVVKAVELYTPDVRVSDDPATIQTSQAMIMPGDGAFGMAMEHLDKLGWIQPLKEYIAGGGYFLGICLGFQLLFSSSEEFGEHAGLGIVPGRVVRFPHGELKVPHMGWNDVEFHHSSAFLTGIENGNYFYFIHSYFPEEVDRDWIIGEVAYGVNFPCIVGRGNLIATQFHPEKSHSAGLKIVENFVRTCRSSDDNHTRH